MAHNSGGYPSPGQANGSGPYPDQNGDTEMGDLGGIGEQLQHAANQPAGDSSEAAAGGYADLQYGGQTYGVQHAFGGGTHAALIDAQFAPQHQPSTPAQPAPTAPMGQGPGAAHAQSPAQNANTPGTEQSGRKKPKISRACDECRRKKV